MAGSRGSIAGRIPGKTLIGRGGPPGGGRSDNGAAASIRLASSRSSQCTEFEALLFSDCQQFALGIGKPELTGPLQAIRDAFSNPEEIDDSPDTAPSKRVAALIPGYHKAFDGNPCRAGNRLGCHASGMSTLQCVVEAVGDTLEVSCTPITAGRQRLPWACGHWSPSAHFNRGYPRLSEIANFPRNSGEGQSLMS